MNALLSTQELIHDFIKSYDPSDPQDRSLRIRLMEQLYAEMYRREREFYSEFIDHGGEA